MLLVANAPDSWEDQGPATEDGVYDDWGTYTQALADAGVLIDGAALQSPDTATTVRVRDGARLLTDGPWADTKEHLISYYLIEVEDLDQALAWAAGMPNARTGSIEVRPLQPGTGVSETIGEHGSR